MIADGLKFWREELRLQTRHKAEWITLVLFFLLVILLLPFVVGPEPELLRRLAPGLIWLAVVLMILLALERLFLQDARDGTLDLMLLSPLPLPLIIFSKIAAFGTLIFGALVVMILPAALLLGLALAALPALIVSFVLGVPVLLLVGAVMAAVTLAVQRGAALLTLLLVPFYIPVLIFAVSAGDAALAQLDPAPHLLLLAALLVVSLPAAPFLIAAALKEAQG